MIAGFQATSGCQVAMQGWPDAAAPVARLHTLLGGVDLVAVRADRVWPLAAARLVQPLDTDEVDGLDGMASPVRSQQALTFEGHSYGVSYGWEPLLLLSRDDAFPDGPPTSLRALWEPANSAFVALPDEPLTLATAALSVGVDDPFSLAASDLAAAGELVHLAPPGYRWASRAGLAALFRSGSVELALGPPRVAARLRGHPGVSATLPVEGAVGLVRALALVTRAPHPVCAYRFLSYMLEPHAQAAIADATGLTPVVPAACRALGRRRCASLHATDQWGPGIQLAHRPITPAAPWARWVADWRALG